MPRRKVISAMHDALCFGSDARNGSPADLAHAFERTRRKLPGVGRREQDRAVLDSHGMYVELATVRVLLDERRVPRHPVETNRRILLPLVGAAEPLFSEPSIQRGKVGHGHEEIQVVVCTRLLTQQGIDTPAAHDPTANPRSGQAFRDLDRLGRRE